MAFKIADRVVETTSTQGTGALSLNGAQTGYSPFVTSIGGGNSTYYCVTDGSQFEIGIGTVTAGAPNTLSRDTVLGNSAGTTSKINFGPGTKTVFGDVPAAKRVYVDSSGAVALGSSAVLDASGRLGIGVTPQAWRTSTYRQMQIGNSTLEGRVGAPTTIWWSNAYYDGAAFSYIGAGTASYLVQDTGTFEFWTAPTGAAGAAAAFTRRLLCDISGNFSVLTGNLAVPGGTVTAGTGLTVSSGSAIVSAGNLLVGAASTSLGTYRGIEVSNANGGTGAELLLTNVSGSQFFAQAYGGGTGIGTLNATALELRTNAVVRMSFDAASGHISSGTDNAQTLGTSSKRWSVVYAGTGTINTSDGAEKTVRSLLSDAEMRAWARVSPLIFQFNDSLAVKGDAARLHAGYIAQEVAAAFAAEGLDASRYALWCQDDKLEEVTLTRTIRRQRVEMTAEEVAEVVIENGAPVQRLTVRQIERPLFEMKPVCRPDGTLVLIEEARIDDAIGETATDMVPLLHPVPVMDDVEEVYTEMRPTGEKRLGLRYDQCLVFETAYLRQLNASLERRIMALEEGAA